MSQDCLRTVTTLPWPAPSPDLSLIEHIWDHLGRRVGHPTSLNELEARSVESDLRVSLVNNGLVGPYSATVLVTLPSAPDHRPPRLESAR
ncbi:transposable element Tcb2 transposase [Trichonephila clavipes]|nr:transposable element Tcb2 transposase [Trichonephila clavipes]